MSRTATARLTALVSGIFRSRLLDDAGGLATVEAMPLAKKRSLVSRSGLFDVAWYLARCSDDPSATNDPIAHYLSAGETAGRKPNRLFDPIWYRENQMAGGWSIVSPLVHYILVGARKGLRTSIDFDPAYYLAANPDVAAAGLEPLSHFIRYGALEGRLGTFLPCAGGWFGSVRVCGFGDADRAIFESICSDAQQAAPAILHILHKAGGGTERAVADRLSAASNDERHLVLMAESSKLGLSLALLVPKGESTQRFDFDLGSASQLAAVLRPLKIGRVIVHQPLGLMASLPSFLAELKVPYDVSVHDYSLICPRSSFVTVRGRYCGEPDASGCNNCLGQLPQGPTRDIVAWRSVGFGILRGADKVECALEDVARRVRGYVPEARVTLVPLPQPEKRTPNIPRLRATEKLRVSVIGHCSTAKGGDFLLDCVEAALRARAQIAWSVIGSFSGGNLKRARRLKHAISVTGAYAPASLDRILIEFDPHVLLFPQRCIETWSYALSEALVSGRVILAPDLGAFGDRLRGVAEAYRFAESDTPRSIIERIQELRDSLLLRPSDGLAGDA